MTYTCMQETWEAYRTHYAESANRGFGGPIVARDSEPQSGNVSAANVDTGKIAWQAKTPQPMIGGALTTAGGLTFAGEGNGLFKASDAKSGKVLWSFQAGAGGKSGPVGLPGEGKPIIAVSAAGRVPPKL